MERLRRAGWDLAEWRDFPASWARPAFTREIAIDAVAQEVHALAALTARATNVRDLLFVDTAVVRRASDELRLLVLQPGAGSDYDAAESVLVDLRRDRDPARAQGIVASFARRAGVDVHAAHHRCCSHSLDLPPTRRRSPAFAARRLRERASIGTHSGRRPAALSIFSTSCCARAILIRERGDVRRAFSSDSSALFVENFQDTDPLQAEISLLLSADEQRSATGPGAPRSGEVFSSRPKQSLYRFRRADVCTIAAVASSWRCRGAALRCPRSRSGPHIHNAVNAAFARGAGDPARCSRYVGLSPYRPSRDQPSFVALPVRTYRGEISLAAIERSLPDSSAPLSTPSNESGWQVTERRSAGAGPRRAPPVRLCSAVCQYGTT